MAVEKLTPHISKLLQGQGHFFDPSELFLLVENLPTYLPLESVKVIIICRDDYSNQQDCKVKEIIKSGIIKAEIPNISKFHIMVTLEENEKKYTSNMVEFNDTKQNCFSIFRDIHIGIMELKNIVERFKEDKKEAGKAIKALNQCYQSQYEDGNSLFHDAIFCDCFPELKDIAAQHLNLFYDATNDFGEGVLHYACRLNKYECIAALMALRCSLRQQDHSKSTPFHLAIKYEAKESMLVFQKILANDKDPLSEQVENSLRVYDLKGHTPLHAAVLNNREDLVVAIIRYCRANNKLDICRMEVLGGGARILHLAKSKNFQKLWKSIATEMPEAVYLTDYAGRTSTTPDLRKVRRIHHGRADRHSHPYKKGPTHEITPKINMQQHFNGNLENNFTQLHISPDKTSASL